MVIFTFSVTMQIFYLTVILLIIAESLKRLDFFDNKFIIFYLLVISMLINFIFYGVSVKTLFESIISVSFAVLLYDIYKAIKKILSNHTF